MVKKRFTKKLKKQPKKGGDANAFRNDDVFVQKPLPVEQIKSQEEKNNGEEIMTEQALTKPLLPEIREQELPNTDENLQKMNETKDNTRNIELEIGLKQMRLNSVINQIKNLNDILGSKNNLLNIYSSKNRITRKLKNLFFNNKNASEKKNIKIEIENVKKEIETLEQEKINLENEIKHLEQEKNKKPVIDEDDDDDMFNDISKAGRRTRRKKIKKVQKKSLKRKNKK
jgi:hypothetical protein